MEYISSNTAFVVYHIWYDANELGWGIYKRDKPFLITIKDQSAFKKCPHDKSLTWIDPEVGEIFDSEISVECYEGTLPLDKISESTIPNF